MSIKQQSAKVLRTMGFTDIATAAKKQKCSERSLQLLARKGAISGAFYFGRSWAIPTSFKFERSPAGRKPKA